MLSAERNAEADNTETLIFRTSQKLNLIFRFIIHSLEENNDKHSITSNTLCITVGNHIMHYACNLKISQLSAGPGCSKLG